MGEHHGLHAVSQFQRAAALVRREAHPDGSVFEVGAGARAWPDPAGDRHGQLKGSLRRPIDGVPSDRYLYGSAGDDGWYAYGGTPDG